ncbi:MAG: hypothetical protein R3Y33_04440 [Clostridia bacterium]
MSMPSIPDLNPNLSVQRDDALNIILSSIGMEELSMAHLLNAEAEKIQFALGTLETAEGKAATLDQILETNRNAGRMVRDVIKNQMLLTMKMEDTVDLAEKVAIEKARAEAAEETKEEVTEESKEEAVAEKEAPTAEPEPAEEQAQA